MKKFLLKTAKIVGTTTDQAWSQVHTFSPTEDEKLLKRGHFLAVISLSDLAKGIEPAAAGKEMISRLHEEYYGHLEEKAIHQLAKALEQILAETKEEAKVEIEAVALVEGVIYFAIAGKGKILIQRKGRLATILSGKEKKVEVASGRVESGDLFLLGSQKFFSLLDEEVIKTALSANSTNEAAELLMPVVHKQEENGATAASVLKLEAKIEEKEALDSEEVLLEKKPEVVSKRLVKEMVLGKISQILKPITKMGQMFFLKVGKKLKRRAIYLSGEESKKQKPKRTLITVALILAVLLLVSAVLGIRQKNRQQDGSGLGMILKQATIKKEEGEALIDLNPIRARQLLIEARELIEEIDAENMTQAIFDLQAELEQSLSSVMREHEVEPRSLFDLVIIKDDAWGNDLAVSGEEMIVFDQSKKTIYKVGIDGKNSSILTGGEDLSGGQQVAAFLPKIYLLTDRGILQFDRETKRQSLVIETDENWGEIVDLRAFGGNLYLLDKQGEIWKYPGLEGGFGSYRRWVKNEEADFSNAVAMSIDGSVWVLKNDGRIWKYTQGVKDTFVIAGLDKPLDNPAAIFTDDDQENLYLLDKGNSRVVVINKSGEYHSQYLWQGASEATALIASEEEKKILLLSGNKIYEIEIK